MTETARERGGVATRMVETIRPWTRMGPVIEAHVLLNAESLVVVERDVQVVADNTIFDVVNQLDESD